MGTPMRHQEPWTDEEEQLLIKQLNDNKNIKKIAARHGRTESAILFRMEKLNVYFLQSLGYSHVTHHWKLDDGKWVLTARKPKPVNRADFAELEKACVTALFGAPRQAGKSLLSTWQENLIREIEKTDSITLTKPTAAGKTTFFDFTEPAPAEQEPTYNVGQLLDDHGIFRGSKMVFKSWTDGEIKITDPEGPRRLAKAARALAELLNGLEAGQEAPVFQIEKHSAFGSNFEFYQIRDTKSGNVVFVKYYNEFTPRLGKECTVIRKVELSNLCFHRIRELESVTAPKQPKLFNPVNCFSCDRIKAVHRCFNVFDGNLCKATRRPIIK